MPAHVIESGRGSHPEFSGEQQLRVSCVAFARILDQSGNYLLLVNKNKMEQGRTVLTPIGGGIEVTPVGRRAIMQTFELEEGAFENGDDLRLVIKSKHTHTFRRWFLERTGRELDPRREMREELIDETGILKPSDRAMLDQAPVSLVGYHSEIGSSTRSGSVGKLTQRLSEIFHVTLPEQLMRTIKQTELETSVPLIRFVSPDEITKGMTFDGIEVASIVKALLHPK